MIDHLSYTIILQIHTFNHPKIHAKATISTANSHIFCSTKFAKNCKKMGKLGKIKDKFGKVRKKKENSGKRGKIGKKRQKLGRFFHFALLTERGGYPTEFL